MAKSKTVLVKGTKENGEANDNEVNITKTKEGAIFLSKNNSYDENFIYFYKDQIKDLIKTLRYLEKREA